MISRLNHVNVFVLDQDRAKAFYTETLGFELRNDAILDGFRWLTVGPKDQKDMNILLAYPAPPMFSAEDAESGPRARREGLARRRRVRDGRLPEDVRGAVGEGRHVPPGTGRAAVRDRSALPGRLRELVQPHPAQVARVAKRRSRFLSGPSRVARVRHLSGGARRSCRSPQDPVREDGSGRGALRQTGAPRFARSRR